MIVLLVLLGVGLGISLGLVGYPILLLTLARRENERASVDADRPWARTVIPPRSLETATQPAGPPTVTTGR